MIEWFKKTLGYKRKINGDVVVTGQHPGSPVRTVDSYINVVKELIRKNEITAAGINYIVSSFCAAELKARDKEGNSVDLPILELFNNPNNYHTPTEFWEQTLLHMYGSGNAFILKERKGSQIVGLWPLRPDYIEVIPDAEAIVSHYVYRPSVKEFRLDKSDILHPKFSSYTIPQLGETPLAPAFSSILSDNATKDHMKGTLENNGMPSGIFTSEDDLVDESVLQRMSTYFKNRFGVNGTDKGGIAWMNLGFKFQPVSWSPHDLRVNESMDVWETRILMVLKVHPMLIGANVSKEFSTHANYAAAREAFWQDTLIPLQKRLAETFSKDPDLNPSSDIEFYFDNSKVPAMEGVNERRSARAIAAWDSLLMTRDEARAQLDLEAIGDDEFKTQPSPFGNLFESNRDEANSPDDDSKDEPTEEDIKNAKAFADEILSVKAKVKASPIGGSESLRQALGNLKVANRMYYKFEEWTLQQMKLMGKQLQAGIEDISKAMSSEEKARIIQLVQDQQPIWQVAIEASFTPLAVDMVNAQAAEFNIALNVENPNIQRATRGLASKLAKTMSKDVAASAARIVESAFEEGKSLRDLRQELKPLFIGKDAEVRAARVAQTETIRATNSAAKIRYQEMGATQMQWVALDDACPFCQQLDGTIIGVTEDFAREGETVEGTNGKTMDVTFGDLGHPPIHPNCHCTIVPIIE